MSIRIRHSSIRVAVVAGCVAFVAFAVLTCFWGAAATIAAPAPATTLHERYATNTPVSKLIFPEQSIPLRFSHRKHLARSPLACAYCHERAVDSTSSLDNLLPTETDCATCHAIDRKKHNKQVASGRGPAHCRACHTKLGSADPNSPGGVLVARIRIPVPNLKFNHKAHMSRKMSCQTCHGDMTKVGLATRKQLPKMALCLTCHNGRKASSACTICHLAEPGGFMKTRFTRGMLRPSGVLRGASHDATFGISHRAAAQNSGKFCANCHRKSFCVDCHNGVRKPISLHGNDYLSLHTMDARRNSPNCSSCHRVQSFCVGCHSRSGVAADGRGSEFLGPSSGNLTRRYHPTGWVVFDSSGLRTGAKSRGLAHHSFHAQRNIKQCTACHRESFCLTCHSAQSGNIARVSPHPRTWRNSRRCRSLLARAGRMCLRCHTRVREARCDYMAP